MSEAAESTILVDAHVHIYDCFEISKLLDAASRNFNRAAKNLGLGDEFTAVLLLAETCRDNWFQRAREKCLQNQHLSALENQWIIDKTPDNAVLQARKRIGLTGKKEHIFIMAGRQIVTSEGLEVLALATDSLFEDDLPTISTLSAVRKQDAIPVLPWAVGKWLGKRGKLLSLLLETEALNDLCLGDNSGRPVFWQNPSHFQQAELKGLHLLPGTDPLPFAAEVDRIGSFGFMVRGELSDMQPSFDLKRILRDSSSKLISFGHLESPLRFIINQIRLRML